MVEQTSTHLEELQRLDERIQTVKEKIRTFDPLFEEVEEPALALKSQAETTRSRLQEMKVDERRTELTADEKRERAKMLAERLKGVRNIREEAAVSAELDLVKRALEGDEQEALTLLEQIRKLEERLEDQEAALEEAEAQLEPRKQELIQERDEALKELAELKEERERYTEELDSSELRMYERIRRGGDRRAVARLTPDGACGNCYNMIPLQLQNEIRHGSAMVRCEACGVILTAAETVPGEEEGDEAE